MSFIDCLWVAIAILGGHVVSSSIIALAKKALGITNKESE